MMKLKFNNFRCYVDDTIEIPEKGITLFSAESGKGKTTILNAIIFVLYGDLTKPYSYGATTCSVTLESPKFGLKVTRTCKPNRLIVSHTVNGVTKTEEDVLAQGIIHKIFGMTAEEFNISSYFNQEKHGSILTLAPREQLLFIERVAGLTEEYEEDKNIIKERISFLESEYSKVKIQIDMLNKLIKDKKEILGAHESLNTREINSIKLQYDETHKKITDMQSQLKSKRVLLAKLRAYESNQRESENMKNKLSAELNNFEYLRDAIGEVKSEEEIDRMKQQSEELRCKISNIIKIKEAIKMELEVETIKKEHIDNLTLEINVLRDKVIPEIDLLKTQSLINEYEEVYKKVTEHERLIDDYKKSLDKINQSICMYRNEIIELFAITTKTALKSISTNTTLVTFLKKKIKELETNTSKLEDKLIIAKSKCLSCPKCNAFLILKKETLIESNTSEPVNVEEVESKLNSSQSILINAKEILSNLERLIFELSILNEPEKCNLKCISLKEFQDLSVKISDQYEIKRKIEHIEQQLASKIFPKSIDRLRREIKDKRAGVPKNLDIRGIKIEELEEENNKLELQIDVAWKNRGDYSKFTREINSRSKALDSVTKKFTKSTVNEETQTSISVEQEIVSIEKNITNLNNTLQTLQKTLSVANIYEDYNKIKENLDDVLSKEEALLINLKGVYALEKASKAAHIQTLTKTINNINYHAKVYLDQMFSIPISVKLEVKTHTKNGDLAANLSIGTRIDYNGNADVDIGPISGGEKQRINLALLLAINDLFNSPILMLDECLNNLNKQISLDTLEFLHEMCPNKQILVVSHEDIGGVCDNVLFL